MTVKLAVTNQKGGVGKTTLSINIAGALAHREHKVLLIDLDPQGHSTEGLGLGAAYEEEPPSLYNMLTDTKELNTVNALIRHHEEMDVIPANIDMFNLEPELTQSMRGRERLNMLLNALENEYDFVLVDCPPSLGNLTDNALIACKNVLIPVQAEGTSIRALEILFDQIQTLEEAYDIRIHEVGVIANRVEPDNEARDMMRWMRETFSGRCPVFEVRKRVALKRAWNKGVSIFRHEENTDMQEVFLDIAKHLEEINHG